MPKTRIDEVEVLRFFEAGPIDKVEAVFNIVSDKMRERLRERGGADLARPGRRRRKGQADVPQPHDPTATA